MTTPTRAELLERLRANAHFKEAMNKAKASSHHLRIELYAGTNADPFYVEVNEELRTQRQQHPCDAFQPPPAPVLSCGHA